MTYRITVVFVLDDVCVPRNTARGKGVSTHEADDLALMRSVLVTFPKGVVYLRRETHDVPRLGPEIEDHLVLADREALARCDGASERSSVRRRASMCKGSRVEARNVEPADRRSPRRVFELG